MKNTLWTGDNLYILNGMNSESVDLIYLDPPFNSKRSFSAPIGSKAAGASFKDMWTWRDVDEYYLEKLFTEYPFMTQFIQTIEGIHGKAMMSYVTYMTQRLIEMHRVLKPTGSIYLHCDPTASHYLKIIMDRIFGKNNFRNEIVWHYTGGGRSKNYFSRKHDTLILFAKQKEKMLFNVDSIRVPYKETSGYAKSGIVSKSGKKYFPNKKGTPVDDVWDIPIINPMSSERIGYPTQKPLALLRRIIEASSKKGDIVFDPFCGCATTCVAAQQLGRKWIGIDIEEKAAQVLIDRLTDDAGLFSDFVHRTDIPHRTDIKKVTPTHTIKEKLFKTQKGLCNACKTKFEIRHFDIDHIIPKSKGGGDYYENYQLLCGSCNRIKGNRPMEYLQMKVREIEKKLKQEVTFGS